MNPTPSGSKDINITTTYDAGTFSVPIITDSQVVIDATVAPFISFSNNYSSLHFGTLSYSRATYANSLSGSSTDLAGNTFTISTNATSGYTLTYTARPSLQNVLDETIAVATITGDGDGTLGTEQFAMSAVYSGNGVLLEDYFHNTNNWKFTTEGDTVITTGSPANLETIEMHYIANISSITPAGDYSQTNNWIATGNF